MTAIIDKMLMTSMMYMTMSRTAEKPTGDRQPSIVTIGSPSIIHDGANDTESGLSHRPGTTSAPIWLRYQRSLPHAEIGDVHDRRAVGGEAPSHGSTDTACGSGDDDDCSLNLHGADRRPFGPLEGFPQELGDRVSEAWSRVRP